MSRPGVVVRRSTTLVVRLCALAACVGGLAACRTQQAQPAAHPQPTAPVIRISVQRAVRAMRDDVFFATYKNSTLFIHGTVSSISRQGSGTTVMLDARGGRVSCDLGKQPSPVSVGRSITIKVANPQQDLSRAADGLTISPCKAAQEI